MTSQTPLKANIRPYLFLNVVKPNFTLSGFRELHSQTLGFTRSLVAIVSLEKVVLFSDLAGFGSIRSTLGKSAETPYQYAEIPKQKHLRD
ncbi:MAG: hypothetical protein OXH00_17310 [Candidatus Poribacteria bacterium]|nr:hypothetical protein [Candidatus Poribacteria bacterium]